MNTNAWLLGAAWMGGIVNILGLFAVAWRGGKLEQVLETLVIEVGHLRGWRETSTDWREKSTETLSRIVVLVDNLERRVERLEDHNP